MIYPPPSGANPASTLLQTVSPGRLQLKLQDRVPIWECMTNIHPGNTALRPAAIYNRMQLSPSHCGS